MDDDPAQAGLFDLDDPNIVANSPESRLMARVAARMPEDAVLRPANGAAPTVLVPVVAHGTYGRVTGLAPDRTPITAQGYVVQARALRGGIGGWHHDRLMVVTLAELPDGPAVATVQTVMGGRLTVLTPPDGMPPGEDPPWSRMPVEEQILAARTVLGLRVRVLDGPHNALWAVEGCKEQLCGEVAWWLFGGDYGSWEGRARPVFSTRRIDEAARASRLQPNDENRLPPEPVADAANAAGTPTRRPRESPPGIGRQRRQVTAWLAQGLMYESVADAARRSVSNDFTTADGSVVAVERVDVYLADAARRAQRGEEPSAGLRFRGIAVTFSPADEQAVQMLLSADGAIHVRVPVPTSWINNPEDGRIRKAIGDTISTADRRATALIGAANELADRIGTPLERSLAEPSSPATADSGTGHAPTSSAAVAFLRPPHTLTDPVDSRQLSSPVHAPQPLTTPGNHR